MAVTLNSFKQSVGPYKNSILLVLYVTVAVLICWNIYLFVFPAPDNLYQLIIGDSRPSNPSGGSIGQAQILPAVSPSGFSLQTWIYINDFSYRSGQPKHVFTIASGGKAVSAGGSQHVTMVGLIYPNENKMMIRVHEDPNAVISGNRPSGPDYTEITQLQSLFSSPQSVGSLVTSNDYPVCDIQEIEIQKWMFLAVVVTGRVIDVYVDGKLARSCVTLSEIVIEDPSTNWITLGSNGGWSGLISSTRFFGYSITPATIYELYQAGPAENEGLDKKYGFMGFLAQRLGMNFSSSSMIDEQSAPSIPLLAGASKA